MDALNPLTLTPGIRRLVMSLRGRGFETTDSGDGVANLAAGMHGALDTPHVVVRSTPESLIADSHRLRVAVEKLTRSPLGTIPAGVTIEATYSPVDGVALVMLFGLDDEGAGLRR